MVDKVNNNVAAEANINNPTEEPAISNQVKNDAMRAHGLTGLVGSFVNKLLDKSDAIERSKADGVDIDTITDKTQMLRGLVRYEILASRDQSTLSDTDQLAARKAFLHDVGNKYQAQFEQFPAALKSEDVVGKVEANIVKLLEKNSDIYTERTANNMNRMKDDPNAPDDPIEQARYEKTRAEVKADIVDAGVLALKEYVAGDSPQKNNITQPALNTGTQTQDQNNAVGGP